MPHREEHAMIGGGGRVVTPRSESEQIDEIAALIRAVMRRSRHVPDELHEATRKLALLRRQASQGYHRNPSPSRRGPHFLAGTAVGLLGEVIQVKYTHAHDGKDYKHDFDGDGAIYAIQRDGHRDLLITHTDGAPLWDEFPSKED